MARTTPTEVRNAFERLAEVLGKDTGAAYTRNADGTYTANIGTWILDHNSCYGGYVVEEVYNEGGAITHPLGDRRRTAAEFVGAVWFAIDVAQLATEKAKREH